MPFTIMVARNKERMSDRAAETVGRAIEQRLRRAGAEFVLGLATGSSPVGLYDHLVEAANRGTIDSGRLRTFNLDEYIGLPGDNAQQRLLHPESYSYFMLQNLFGPLQRKPLQTELPWANIIDQSTLMYELQRHPRDWKRVGRDSGHAIVIRRDAKSRYLHWVRNRVLDGYGRMIRKAGGIDLQILGVGGHGHIAFHEAGIPFKVGGLLLVELDESTIHNAVVDGHFPSPEEMPRYALSMSVDLVFKARQVVLLANGKRKTEAITRAVLGEPTPQVPVSYAQLYARRGGDITFVLDEVAAAGILGERKALRRKGITLVDRRKS